jgi:hypothetical protein
MSFTPQKFSNRKRGLNNKYGIDGVAKCVDTQENTINYNSFQNCAYYQSLQATRYAVALYLVCVTTGVLGHS